MNLTKEARQCIGMGERSDRSVPQMRGWWANSCFQIGWWYNEAGQTDYLTTHSNILPVSPVIVWVLRALMKCRLNLPGDSRCYVQFSPRSVLREPLICAIRQESAFRKLYCLNISLPLPTRRSIQDVESGGTSLQVYSQTLGSLKSLCVPQSTTLGSTPA